jgi:PST family polysaccharide transporter
MGGSGTVAIVRLAILAVLARELSPGVFGMMAMSTVVTGFAAAAIDVGFGSAVVQRDRLTASQLWWVFRLNLLLSLGVWGACAAASPSVARFFHEPLVGPVLAVSAAVLPLSAVSLIPRALLMRHLEFRKLAACEITESVTNGLLSVALAITGFGVWSLVAGSLAGGLASAALLTAFSPWRPAAAGPTEDRRALLGFGAAVTLTASFFYWTERIDNLAVGRLLGSQALGIYVVAFNLAIVVAGQLSVGTRVVAFPLFSAVQGDRDRLAAAYHRSVRWSAALAFPCCVLTAALAPELISALLGSRWTSAVLPFRLLLAVGAMRALYGFSGPMLRAIGRPRIELVLQAFLCLGVGVASVLGARGGVNGVAAAVTAFVFCLGGPVFIGVSARVTGLGLYGVLRSAAAPALAAAVGGGAAFFAARAAATLCPLAPSLLPLLSGLAIGLLAYVLGVRALAPDLLAEAHDHLFKGLFTRVRPPASIGTDRQTELAPTSSVTPASAGSSLGEAPVASSEQLSGEGACLPAARSAAEAKALQ